MSEQSTSKFVQRASDLGKILAVVTAVIGIWTFVLKAVSDYQMQLRQAENNRKESARGELRAVVFRELNANRFSDGATVDELLSVIQSSLLPNETVLRSELSTENLWHVLIDLSADGLVMFSDNNRVIAPRFDEVVTAAQQQTKIMTDMMISAEMESHIVNAITYRPDEYSRAELTELILGQDRSQSELFSATVDALIRNGRLVETKSQLLSLSGWKGEVRGEASVFFNNAACKYTTEQLIDQIALRVGFPREKVELVILEDIDAGILVQSNDERISTGKNGVCP